MCIPTGTELSVGAYQTTKKRRIPVDLHHERQLEDEHDRESKRMQENQASVTEALEYGFPSHMLSVCEVMAECT
jgi:hypothetical protein